MKGRENKNGKQSTTRVKVNDKASRRKVKNSLESKGNSKEFSRKDRRQKRKICHTNIIHEYSTGAHAQGRSRDISVHWKRMLVRGKGLLQEERTQSNRSRALAEGRN